MGKKKLHLDILKIEIYVGAIWGLWHSLWWWDVPYLAETISSVVSVTNTVPVTALMNVLTALYQKQNMQISLCLPNVQTCVDIFFPNLRNMHACLHVLISSTARQTKHQNGTTLFSIAVMQSSHPLAQPPPYPEK